VGWRAAAGGEELVEGAGATAAYDLAPGPKILHGKTKRVILHGNRIINCKLMSRKKILIISGTTKTLCRWKVWVGVWRMT
jgi:hypothetical protein